MTNEEMAILVIKAHTFDEIDDLIGEVWEYGDDKHAVTHTLFEINGAIQMAKKMMDVIAQAEKGAEDDERRESDDLAWKA